MVPELHIQAVCEGMTGLPVTAEGIDGYLHGGPGAAGMNRSGTTGILLVFYPEMEDGFSIWAVEDDFQRKLPILPR